MRETKMFCQEEEGAKGTWYSSFFSHKSVVEMCQDSRFPKKIFYCTVRETTEKEGCYWAWWDMETFKFSMVYPGRSLVEMCFPYGPECEIKAGMGLILPVEIVLGPEA